VVLAALVLVALVSWAYSTLNGKEDEEKGENKGDLAARVASRVGKVAREEKTNPQFKAAPVGKGLWRREPYSKEEVAQGVGRNVFLDCGACQGDTLEMFFHKGSIPGRITLNAEFRIPFEYDPSTFTVYAFEANPQHSPTLTKLERQFKNLQVIKETALWTHESTVELMIPTMYDPPEGSTQAPNPHQGASLLGSHRDLAKGMKKVSVPTIDFSAWVREHIKATDFVMMKMNMEGAEYEVLRKMIWEGTLNLVNKAWIWFHSYALPDGWPKDFDRVVNHLMQTKSSCTEMIYQKVE